MAVRRSLPILLLLVGIGLFGHLQAAAQEPLSLQEAIEQRWVEAWGEPVRMGYHQPMVQLRLNPLTSQPIAVRIPRSTLLQPENPAYAPLAIVAAETVQVQAAVTLDLEALSISPTHRFPSVMEPCRYDVAPAATGRLDTLLGVVEGSGSTPTMGAQLAAWTITTGKSAEELAAEYAQLIGPEDVEAAHQLLAQAFPPPEPPNLLPLIGKILGILAGVAVLAVVAIVLLEVFKSRGKAKPGAAPLKPRGRRTTAPSAAPSPEPHAGSALAGAAGPLQDLAIRPRPECIISREALTVIEVSHESISAPHALLDASQSPYEMRDLGSTNGTVLNGTRLETGRATVAVGDTVQLGALVFRLDSDRLEVVQGPLRGRTYPFSAGLVVISRRTLPVQATGDADPGISVAHAFLWKEGTTLYIRDLNSSNGVWVRGERSPGETALNVGDRVRLAASEFIVK